MACCVLLLCRSIKVKRKPAFGLPWQHTFQGVNECLGDHRRALCRSQGRLAATGAEEEERRQTMLWL